MAAPRSPPFRAEHLGSLLRPANLLEKRHAVQQKKDSGADLPALEDSSIRDIVKVQTECGFKAISDGEYRRHMFWGTFFPSLNGFEEIQGPDAGIFRDYVPDIVGLSPRACGREVSGAGAMAWEALADDTMVV